MSECQGSEGGGKKETGDKEEPSTLPGKKEKNENMHRCSMVHCVYSVMAQNKQKMMEKISFPIS